MNPTPCAVGWCNQDALPALSSFPICKEHFEKITYELNAKHRKELVALKKEAAEHNARLVKRQEKRTAWLRSREQVYYVRTGPDTIKIGFTAHLLNRMKSYRLPLTTLLATEPGGRLVERERHQQFADCRYGPKLENFADTPELMAHIQL